MKFNDLGIALMYTGTLATGLANIELNAGTINAIAVLLSALGGMVYAIARAIHIFSHLKSGVPMDDPEKPRAVRDYDRDLPVEVDAKRFERSAK